MKILSQNLKKCSVVLAAKVFIFYFFLFFPEKPANCLSEHPALLQTLKTDIRGRTSNVFQNILKKWEILYGTQAVPPLFEIASDKSNNDADRYIAIMGAAKLGGAGSAPGLISLLKDSSWMIRSAALRALSFQQNLLSNKDSSAILPLLKDSALVVRLEAIDAAEKLRPEGTVEALVQTLSNLDNYHFGKAIWVPQRTLSALSKLHVKSVAPHLVTLLEHKNDRELQLKTMDTLASLTGMRPNSSLSHEEKIKFWKKKFTNL